MTQQGTLTTSLLEQAFESMKLTSTLLKEYANSNPPPMTRQHMELLGGFTRKIRSRVVMICYKQQNSPTQIALALRLTEQEVLRIIVENLEKETRDEEERKTK